MREPLTYEIATGAAEHGIARARQDGRAVCVVVVNRSGIIKTLLADDGVGVLGVETARRKAYTSAVSGKTTAQFAAFAASPTMQHSPVHLVDAELLPVAGGVPIVTADGEVIGGIGVGGADDITDGAIAGDALDSISGLVG
ncbi:heme-binding protein [Rhodococcus sp. BP-149]|uniref:GlcG/HbpS family heme-binding protein n=1 Tax=unclassified Rhodococcus (in: high G+C Gram-positive bacteria) TaxID=192944 RepID=UPI001C9AA183|nr:MULTISPECIES: heme-binding protein [unclassified Rhodococcus (in: high G+C Gram-positive bacteria)]MBY6685627.1 heme-binding protein [Rhodococcus sp. BP-288]MBY6694825.1 heme-binding protein [Rhodococcus sp. BP-188]MBY6696671.1 heme-binding protein [Rhodococcus sp. BP-285]MBY6703327.1 heme-binding protein [Rhodococcus sp. BP-283]MBY6710719.1 heme-binding protein [Rhodococcus sp. BP-160]